MVEDHFYLKQIWSFKIKNILLLLLLSAQIFALSINESLLKVHATLIPKIYLMDSNFQEKIKDNRLKIEIVYQKGKYNEALLLKKNIDTRYKNGIKSFKISAKLVLYSTLKSDNANIYYLFPSSKENIKKVVNLAKKSRALTFSYLQSDLSYGVMISVDISKKIKPILNLNAIKNNNIALRPILIDISTIYNKVAVSKEQKQILNFNDVQGSYYLALNSILMDMLYIEEVKI
jgi:hypothetical protein